MNVGYKISMGAFSLVPGEGLTYLRTSASLDVPVNEGLVCFVNEEKVTLKQGDPVKIEAGYDSSLKLIFTGVVERVTVHFKEVEVRCAGCFNSLAASRMNLSYEGQSSGDIVKDILGQCGIKEEKVEPGLSYADYYIGDNRTLWENCRLLAMRNGFDFYATPEDKGVFAPYSPGSPVELVYGEDLLEMEEESFVSSIEGVELFGESPVGQGEGEDASSWLTKKEVKGSSGKSSGNIFRQADFSLRTKDMAGKAAENIASPLATVLRGRALLIGNPGVAAGSTVKFKDLPSSFEGGEHKVVGVSQLLDSTRGYVTEITWEKK